MNSGINGLILKFLLLVPIILQSCGEYEAAQEAPATVVVSGLVIDQIWQTPVIGASVETEDGSISTVTDDTGHWQLKVPGESDPVLKVSKKAAGFFSAEYVPSYNTVPVSMGITEFDLITINRTMYSLFIAFSGALIPEEDKGRECLMMGAAAGFINSDYPQKMTIFEEVTIEVSPPEVTLKYLGPLGPDPALVATGPLGTFMMVIPNATEVRAVTISGSKPGNSFITMEQKAKPGAFVPVGLIDLFYVP